jgi:hypothetical protein
MHSNPVAGAEPISGIAKRSQLAIIYIDDDVDIRSCANPRADQIECGSARGAASDPCGLSELWVDVGAGIPALSHSVYSPGLDLGSESRAGQARVVQFVRGSKAAES